MSRWEIGRGEVLLGRGLVGRWRGSDLLALNNASSCYLMCITN